ncbi:hypothetical protein FSP39_022194 [Pinctada imbricata]|uniref:Uncharacterized protein n=1 Tax=Pinctada imbricata TaxID=66713 RepID=A0AA88YPE6_PINIB|nr:hypothetical protein FSP39_022194 [Pinctada imbricata]
MFHADDGTEVQKLLPLERYHQNIPTVETNRALIENHLRKPGDRLVLVASLASAIDTFELELKTREPGYIKVDSFGDWSNVSEKEGCTVLLSCILKACRDGSIIRHRRELENIAEEGGKLKLIIPVREDVFDIEKNNLSNLPLFQKIAYHKIA